MATQTLKIAYAISGATLTLDLYPLAGGAALASALALVVDANNPQVYAVARAGTDAGWYIGVLKDGGVEQFNGPYFFELANVTADYWGSLQPPARLADDMVTELRSGLSTHSAADVWAVASRTLTAFSFAVDLSAAAVTLIWDKATSALTTAGSIGKWILDKLDVVLSTRATPAQVNTECDTALADYDGPTNAEMVARTLVAASYGTSANQVTMLAQIAAVKAVVDAILADTGTDGVVLASISAALCNKIADHVRRRTQANVEASADGDALNLLSLYGFIQQAQESSVSGAVLTVNKTDASLLGTRTLATSGGADPITGVS